MQRFRNCRVLRRFVKIFCPLFLLLALPLNAATPPANSSAPAPQRALNEQAQDIKKQALELNRDIMGKYRDQMRKFYFDPTKYKTYLEQLGIQYPTIKKQ